MDGLPRRFGPFVLLEHLGKGASGAVYFARTVERGAAGIDRLVVKVLHPHLTEDPLVVERFRHEAQVAVAIDSPYVVKVHALGTVDDHLFIAMAYVEGLTVGEVLAGNQTANRTMTISTALDIARDGVRGLVAIHGAGGFIHRDVAPKNMIAGVDGVTKLIDLGIAKSDIQSWRTATGVIVGSPGYMSPEQVIAEDVDHRSDIFGIGVVLFELLTNRKFIPRGSLATTLSASRTPPVRAPSTERPEVPLPVDELVLRALAPNREQRFQSATEMLDAIEAVRALVPDEPDAFVADLIAGGADRPAMDATAVVPMALTADDVEQHTQTFAMSDHMLTRPSFPQATPDRSSYARRFATFGMLFAVMIVAAVLSASYGSSPPRPALETVVAPPPTPPGVTQRATVPPLPTERVEPVAPIASDVPSRREPARRTSKKRPTPAVESTSPPKTELETPPEPPDASTQLAARVQSMLQRAQQIKKRAPAHAEAIDMLIGDIAKERISTDAEAALQRLTTIERRLTDLASK